MRERVPKPTCNSGHEEIEFLCPDCHALAVAIGHVWQDMLRHDERMAKQHEWGRHKAPRLGCWLCTLSAKVDANAAAAALADIFNPRPAGWVPAGFTKGKRGPSHRPTSTRERESN